MNQSVSQPTYPPQAVCTPANPKRAFPFLFQHNYNKQNDNGSLQEKKQENGRTGKFDLE